MVPNLTADQRREENSGMRRSVLPVSQDKEVIPQPWWQHHRAFETQRKMETSSR